ncbi:MAG: hypothetical protein IT372_35375 [Polyangiaceae bacterium]|nr:hypothetical protein [Polyangiaceae bacterium]
MSKQPFSSSIHRAASRAAALVLAAASLASAGCGIGPGDYIMYSVAVAAPKPGKDCDVSDNVKSDSSTFRDSQTFILYAGPEDKYYLDVGQVTLEGAEDGDGFKFSGKSVDIEFLGGATNDKVEDTQTTTITMTIDGAAVDGTISSKHAIKYTCANPAQCPESASCTQSASYVGAEIEDVDLEHDPY